MSDRKIRVGVVGVGSLGQWHARIYSELPAAELAGVYDINQARAKEIARRYRTRDTPQDNREVARTAHCAGARIYRPTRGTQSCRGLE